jgi:hypothetical protein
MKMSMMAFWQQQVDAQIKWIESCGATRAGYVARYGAADNPNKSGNGGEAIYNADIAYLEKLTQKLNRSIHRKKMERT